MKKDCCLILVDIIKHEERLSSQTCGYVLHLSSFSGKLT